MTGTLEEKVERDVRAHPDDYSTAGKWVDDYSLSHGSRLKAKLLQKKKEFDESGIQKEANKLKRKARTTGTKTAKEAAERFARSCQSRKDDLTKLKKEIRAFDAYLKTPKGEPPVRNSVLIKEAWNNAYNEKPRDIKKILLIYWVLTDRLVDSDEPGLTLFEKWSYGDDRECAEPEEYFGTRHETLNEMISIDSKMIPTVEAAMRATTRNRETEQKVSGGKAGNDEAYIHFTKAIKLSNGILTRKKLDKALNQDEPMKVRSKKPSKNRRIVHIQDVLSLIGKLSENNNVGEEAARMFGEYQKAHQKKTQAKIDLD